MDKEVKARLRAVVHQEGISQRKIAEKTGYSNQMVNMSLSQKYEVLSPNFLNAFFEAFPEVAAKHKEQILNGTGATTLFNNPAEVEELRKTVVEQGAIIKELRYNLEYYRNLFEKALQLHPDLVKLLSPFALQNELGVNSSLHGVLIHEGANKGAKKIALGTKARFIVVLPKILPR